MKPSRICPPELEGFLVRLVDPHSDKIDHPRLAQLLARDPQARSYYRQYVQLHARLLLLAESPLAWPPPRPSDDSGQGERPSRLPQRLAWRWMLHPTPGVMAVLWGVLSIAIVLAALAIVQAPTTRTPAETPAGAVARLTGEWDCVWEEDGQPPPAGHFASGAILALKSGRAEVTLSDGAQVILEGPARFRVDSAASGRLEQGKLTVQVLVETNGFTLHTPSAMVVDLGTGFGVWVRPPFVTEVHVFEGEVAIQAASDGNDEPAGPVRRVTAGRAVRVDSAKTFEVREIAYDHSRFAQRPPRAAHVQAHQGGGLLRSDGDAALGGNATGVRRIGSSEQQDIALTNIFLFRLPELDRPDRIAGARLMLTYKSADGSPEFDVDLYGLGYVPSAAIEPDWFYEGEYDRSSWADYGTGSAASAVTKIQPRCITPQTQFGRIYVDAPKLREHLQSLYRDGAKGGDFAVFRLNAVVSTQTIDRKTGYNVVHAPTVRPFTVPGELPMLTLIMRDPFAPLPGEAPSDP